MSALERLLCLCQFSEIVQLSTKTLHVQYVYKNESTRLCGLYTAYY